MHWRPEWRSYFLTDPKDRVSKQPLFWLADYAVSQDAGHFLTQKMNTRTIANGSGFIQPIVQVTEFFTIPIAAKMSLTSG